MSDELREAAKQHLVSHRDDNQAVPCLIRIEGGRDRVAIADAAGWPPVGHELAHGGNLQREERVEHGDVDISTLTVSLTLVQGSANRPARKDAGTQIAERLAHPCRWPVSLPCNVHETGHCLDNEIVGRPVGHGARLSKTGNACIDQSRIYRTSAIVVDAKPHGHAWPEVLDHHVGLTDESAEDVDAFVSREVEGQALFAAI